MDVKRIGKAIAFLRKEHGFTQKELAERIGVSDKAVSKWERGLGSPDISLLAGLSIALDTDIESLLEGNLAHTDHQWKGIILQRGSAVPFDYPIYDKPMLDYLLGCFLLVGIKQILLVGEDESKRVVDLVRERNHMLGIHITTADAADFGCDKISAYLDGWNAMLLVEPAMIYGCDLTKYFQRAMNSCTMVSALRIKNGVGEYDELPFRLLSSDFISGMKLKSNDLDDFLEHIGKSNAVNSNDVSRGMIHLPIKRIDDAIRCAQFVQMIQEAQNIKVSCLKEIAFKRGLIL